MKKYLIALVLIIFCFGFIQQQHIAVIAKKGSDNGCPSGTYLSWWNGEFPSDTDQICYNNGTSNKDGTATGATIDTWTTFGISGPTNGGTYGVLLNAANEHIAFVIASKDLIDTDIGTIAMDIYLDSTTGDNTVIQITAPAATNEITVSIKNDGAISFTYEDGGTQYTTLGTNNISDDTWTEIRVSWSISGNVMSTKVGANIWQEDSKAIDAFSETADHYAIGDGVSGSTISDTVYIDNFRVSDTYQDESL